MKAREGLHTGHCMWTCKKFPRHDHHIVLGGLLITHKEMGEKGVKAGKANRRLTVKAICL